MSRIGAKPLVVPAGVTVRIEGSLVGVKGPKGELSRTVPEGIGVQLGDGRVQVSRASDSKLARSLHGTTRTLLSNMIVGTVTGYSKTLDIEGVGFKAEKQGAKVLLSLGFSKPVEYVPPKGVTVGVEGGAVTVSGIDKQLVGDVAARIRAFHPPEPYKGKGVRYRGEYVRRKAGKTVA